MEQRRKLSNLILDPKSLIRLSFPFLILAGISVATMVTIQIQVMRALESTVLFGVENLEAINQLHQIQQTVTLTGSLGIVIFCFTCLGIWVLVSHRIFGPMISIRRHVEKLIAGDYSSRITPRPSDEFKELTADLNRLAETLGQKR